jgi:hypothetical protein
MKIRSILRAGAAFASALGAPAAAHERGETVAPHFGRAIPDIPGKSLVASLSTMRRVAAHCTEKFGK